MGFSIPGMLCRFTQRSRAKLAKSTESTAIEVPGQRPKALPISAQTMRMSNDSFSKVFACRKAGWTTKDRGKAEQIPLSGRLPTACASLWGPIVKRASCGYASQSPQGVELPAIGSLINVPLAAERMWGYSISGVYYSGGLIILVLSRCSCMISISEPSPRTYLEML